MKRARAWLDAHGIQYRFHDYKVAGIDEKHLKRWCKATGWESLLNRAGQTFRKLPPASQENIDERKAIALMGEFPSMIKRPVLESGRSLIVGFVAEKYEDAFD